MDWFEPTLKWYLTTTLITLAMAPIVILAFRHVHDRGASVVRPLGLLFLIWPVWLLASIGEEGIVPFSGTALWVTAGAVGVTSWVIGIRKQIVNRKTLVHLGLAEAGYLVLFSGYLFLRGFVPGVGGPNIIDQEKPMDLMMLSSSMRATSMPPADAWLSGETINYYYLGYALWAGVGKMIDTTPAITYNLALASIFSMTVVAVVGTVVNFLSRFTPRRVARAGGIAAALLMVFIGNPWAAWEIIRDADAQWNMWPFDGIMWNATRVIDVTETTDAISEFPAFSFIFADLHPHLMTMPYAITALAFAWMFMSLPSENSAIARIGRLAMAGVATTALYAMNSWDFPTWFAIVAFGILVSPGFHYLSHRLIGIVLTLIVGVLAWSPFIVAFETPVQTADTGFADTVRDIPVVGSVFASIGGYTGERTSIQDYFSIFGFFYPILIIALLIAVRSSQQEDDDPMVARLAMVSGIILVAIGILIPAPLVILVGIPMLVGLVVILRSTNVTIELLIAGLATLSFALTLIPEFFYLLDAFGTRMNTIFKLYLQVWLLSAVATALALVYLWNRARRWRPAQGLVALAGAVIILTGLTYPVVAASQWAQIKNPDRDWEGIDGLAWLQESQAADPATYNALQWLWKNADNDDVVLAAGGCAYVAPVGFPSAATGIPAIIGWDNHERQWRLSDEQINTEIVDRVAAIIDLFARPTEELLNEYDVSLLYIGRPELSGVPGVEPSPTCAPGPFPEATSPEFPGPGWTEVFSEDGVRILRRDTGA